MGSAEHFLPWTVAWIAYNLTLWVFLVICAPVWIPWMLCARKRRSNFLARLALGGGLRSSRTTNPHFWVHSVSVGETLAAAPFIRKLKSAAPDAVITLSTVTITGQDTARRALMESVDAVIYFPLDLSFICSRFLDRIRPDAVVILETEIWPNFLAECAKRNIPVVILNGRISEKSFNGYRRISWLFRRVLRDISVIGAQTPEDARRYSDLRCDSGDVFPTGNMKYDMAVPVTEHVLASLMSRVRESGGRWLVAGSTHEGEETAILKGFAKARVYDPHLHLLIAPRHPERFDRVERLCVEAGLSVTRKAICPEDGLSEAVHILLLDTVGELSGAYALADIAFVGGSLVPVGGHNILEPACFGVPVMTGTYMENFREMASLFRRSDAISVVDSPEAFGTVLLDLLKDPESASRMGGRGRNLIRSCQGATDRNVALVLDAMRNRKDSGK